MTDRIRLDLSRLELSMILRALVDSVRALPIEGATRERAATALALTTLAAQIHVAATAMEEGGDK